MLATKKGSEKWVRKKPFLFISREKRRERRLFGALGKEEGKEKVEVADVRKRRRAPLRPPFSPSLLRSFHLFKCQGS